MQRKFKSPEDEIAYLKGRVQRLEREQVVMARNVARGLANLDFFLDFYDPVMLKRKQAMEDDDVS